jgi:hypothetical protein
MIYTQEAQYNKSIACLRKIQKITGNGKMVLKTIISLFFFEKERVLSSETVLFQKIKASDA